MLALLELRQEPRLFALLLEALERALEGLVGFDNDLGHSAPPSLKHTWTNDKSIPRRAFLGNRLSRTLPGRGDVRGATTLHRLALRGPAPDGGPLPAHGRALVG